MPPFKIDAPDNIPDISVDGKELFATMMSETARLDEHIFLAIQKLKGTYPVVYFISLLKKKCIRKR